MKRRNFLKILGAVFASPVVVPPKVIGKGGAWVISRTGATPDKFKEGEEILLPTFEIASNPSVSLSEIKARRFCIMDQASIKAKEAIMKEEDLKIFKVLNNLIESGNKNAKI